MIRQLTYAEAIREAQEQLLESDPSVYLLGLGVPTPTGVFGTTQGLVDRFGPDRVFETELNETRYDQAAAGLGCHGEHVSDQAALDAALGRAYKSKLPTLY